MVFGIGRKKPTTEQRIAEHVQQHETAAMQATRQMINEDHCPGDLITGKWASMSETEILMDIASRRGSYKRAIITRAVMDRDALEAKARKKYGE